MVENSPQQLRWLRQASPRKPRQACPPRALRQGFAPLLPLFLPAVKDLVGVEPVHEKLYDGIFIWLI